MKKTENAVEREVYWIEFYGTFSKGYNATKGGDGKPYVDEEFVLNALFENDLNCNQTAKTIQVNQKTVIKIARKFGFFVSHHAKNGEASKINKITKEMAMQVKSLYVPKSFGKRKIAKTLGISVYIVDDIIRGKSWANV